jgi:hypothetical protein
MKVFENVLIQWSAVAAGGLAVMGVQMTWHVDLRCHVVMLSDVTVMITVCCVAATHSSPYG